MGDRRLQQLDHTVTIKLVSGVCYLANVAELAPPPLLLQLRQPDVTGEETQKCTAT